MAADQTSSSGKDGKRRSEIVTVRLDPKLKYLAELAARSQRRTLSSYIEWAIQDSLSRVHPTHDSRSVDGTPSLAEAAAPLWDVDEPDRFAKLALKYPDLLNHEEQKLWKLIQENGSLWFGGWGGKGEWCWVVSEEFLVFLELRKHWETFQRVARGELPTSALPDWPKHFSEVSPASFNEEPPDYEEGPPPDYEVPPD